MKNIKTLFSYAKKYKRRYITGIIFLLLVDIAQLIPPKLIGNLVDNMSNHQATSGMVLKCVLYIIAITIVIVVGRFMWRVYIIGSSKYVEYDLRRTLFSHLQTLSQNFYTENRTGDLMALATNDVNAVRMAVGPGIIMITDAIVMTLTTLAIMLSINYKLTLLSLIPLPFVALISLKFGRLIHGRFKKVQECFSKLTDVVQENFSGIRVVKSFVQEAKECEKFEKENTNNFNANMKLVKLFGIFFPLIETVASLSSVLLLGIGGTFVIYGYISLGNFVTFNMYLGSLIWPMMAVGQVINTLQRGFASLERIQDVVNQKPEIYDKNVDESATIDGNIVIKDFTFTYPSAAVPSLKNVSLTLKKGQTLGIVGKTGSGKSTLVTSLVRLYPIEHDKIAINGYDINEIPLKTLRENIGFVTQDAFLFSTNITENINLANDNLDLEKVIESSKMSDIYDNIMDFSNQFDTMVGEKGVTLSGGQKQRLSISRALIKNPEVLIFDDCLSAVDAKTEVKILENLKKIMKNKTSIIISHRISAVKDADVIVVLDNGEIVERGTHEELAVSNGIYHSMYEKQQLEEKIEADEEV